MAIPRFGNWDKDDIPYSVYFDNARKERSGVRNNPDNPEEDHDTSEEEETIEDGSSDLDHQSEKDSIQIYAATTPEKLTFPGKQRKGIGGSLGLETPPGGGLSRGGDKKVFNNTCSINNFDRSSSSEMKFPKLSRQGSQTQQHQRRPSIPKFYSLTDNNVRYTASTENVCKNRGRSKMNPRDPDETHNAFWFPKGSPGNDRDISPRMPPRRRTTVRSRTPENGNRMDPRHSLGHHKITSEDRNSTLRSSSTNSSSGWRNSESFRRSNMNQPDHSPFQKSPSAPSFTRWDETTAEGYSDTFNKAKGEKQNESIKDRSAPTLLIVPSNNPSNQNHQKRESIFSRLKISCCLFPNEKE